jgi:DeoR/GlpR family transcriptional regulator of sugar metabolism
MGKYDLRRERVLEMLKQKGRLSAQEISEEFSISMPTVRRLCRSLSEEGCAIRTRGGIHYMPENRQPYSYNLKSREYTKEKMRIAKYAAGLLQEGEVIFLESGTTVSHFAECLADRLREGTLKEVMVFTNSLTNLEIFYPYCGVNMIGGLFRSERKDFAGIIGERTLKGPA